MFAPSTAGNQTDDEAEAGYHGARLTELPRSRIHSASSFAMNVT